MPTAPDPIPEWPEPIPLSTDPENFDARADATWEAADDVVAATNAANAITYANAVEVAALAVDIEASALVAAEAAGLAVRSTSTLAVGADAHAIHFTAPKPLLAVLNKRLAVVLESDPTIRMIGSATTVTDSDDIVLTVVSSGVSGSGSYSSWLVIDAAFLQPAATAEEIRAAVSDAVAISPMGIKDALATETLAFGGTVTIDAAEGKNWDLDANTSFTLGAVSNTYPGDVISITVTHTAGGNVLAVGSAWKRRGGLGILSTTNGYVDEIIGIVKTVDGSGNATRIVYDVLRNPT